eukprot:scaffold10253_cov124-Isochrysis_galbana.AAC.4
MRDTSDAQSASSHARTGPSIRDTSVSVHGQCATPAPGLSCRSTSSRPTAAHARSYARSAPSALSADAACTDLRRGNSGSCSRALATTRTSSASSASACPPAPQRAAVGGAPPLPEPPPNSSHSSRRNASLPAAPCAAPNSSSPPCPKMRRLLRGAARRECRARSMRGRCIE